MPENAAEKPVEKDPSTNIFEIFAAEEREDQRKIVVSFLLAAVLHVLFFPVIMVMTRWYVDSGSLARSGEAPRVFVLGQERFSPPRARPVRLPKHKKVPIPDSIPGEPEPMSTDIVFGIPDARSFHLIPKPRIASTGGSAEPNDAPYGDVFYKGYGTNPFIDAEDDRYSTFGLDVDTGSYTIARRYLNDGHLPPADAIRIEEFVNYFDYGEAPPEKGDFAIHAEGSPAPFGENERYYLLRFHLLGREVATSHRPPADLVFVVDVSGSMAIANRLGLVKEALHLLVGQMREDDRIGLVVYGSRGRVVLETTPDHHAIRHAIDGLLTGGSTYAEEGIRLGYEMAVRHRRDGVIRRVILCSDGVANVGRTSSGSILDVIRRHADDGVELTTVGFGMGNYNDELMEQLADDGNGRYAYVDDLREARRIFVENLTGTLHTIAAEARVQVEFRPDVVARYRLLGYENRAIADERFRDDSVDAGEIGAGHAVTALYEVKLHRELDPRDEVATLSLRYGSVAEKEIVEIARTVTGADFHGSWETSSKVLRLTSLVAEFAEILKESYWAQDGDLDEVHRLSREVSAEFPDDQEVTGLVRLMELAAGLRPKDS